LITPDCLVGVSKHSCQRTTQALTQQFEGRNLAYCDCFGIVTFQQINKFFVTIVFFIIDKMSSRTGWNGFAGRIWPAYRSL